MMGKRFNWATGKLEERKPDGAYFHCALPGCDNLYDHRYKPLMDKVRIPIFGAVYIPRGLNLSTPKAFQREWKICDDCIKMFYGMGRKDAFYLFASKMAPETQVTVEEVQATFDALVDKRPYYERFYCDASPWVQRYLERFPRYQKFITVYTTPWWKVSKHVNKFIGLVKIAKLAALTTDEIVTCVRGITGSNEEPEFSEKKAQDAVEKFVTPVPEMSSALSAKGLTDAMELYGDLPCSCPPCRASRRVKKRVFKIFNIFNMVYGLRIFWRKIGNWISKIIRRKQ